MPIRGTCGDHVLTVRFEKNLKDEDEDLAGETVHKSLQGQVAIAIDPEASGLGMFNVVIHELLHAQEYVFGYDIDHSTIYVMASGLCQALISTGIMSPEEFEARLRRLMMESERKEEK